MRKLQRYIPTTLTASAVTTALTSICLFLVAIWTPQWQVAHDGDGQGFSGCENACYIYQANHQWFATAWLFVIVTLLLATGRIVMWKLDESHGH